jgi:hypothetical protein
MLAWPDTAILPESRTALPAVRHPGSPTRLRRDSCLKTYTHSCRVGSRSDAAEQSSPGVFHRTRHHYRVCFCSDRARDFLHGCGRSTLAPLKIAQPRIQLSCLQAPLDDLLDAPGREWAGNPELEHTGSSRALPGY